MDVYFCLKMGCTVRVQCLDCLAVPGIPLGSKISNVSLILQSISFEWWPDLLSPLLLSSSGPSGK